MVNLFTHKKTVYYLVVEVKTFPVPNFFFWGNAFPQNRPKILPRVIDHTVFLHAEERRCKEFSMLGFTLLLSALSSPGWQPSSACFSPAKPFR
jgi:hypothetical protein